MINNSSEDPHRFVPADEDCPGKRYDPDKFSELEGKLVGSPKT
jgi:hypothetical protein